MAELLSRVGPLQSGSQLKAEVKHLLWKPLDLKPTLADRLTFKELWRKMRPDSHPHPWLLRARSGKANKQKSTLITSHWNEMTESPRKHRDIYIKVMTQRLSSRCWSGKQEQSRQKTSRRDKDASELSSLRCGYLLIISQPRAAGQLQTHACTHTHRALLLWSARTQHTWDSCVYGVCVCWSEEMSEGKR